LIGLDRKVRVKVRGFVVVKRSEWAEEGHIYLDLDNVHRFLGAGTGGEQCGERWT
jgi:hypothetical protein